MVVALSEERSLPTPEVRCSNPVIRNFYTTFIYFSLLNSWLYIKRGRGWTIFLIESFKIRRKKQLMTLLKWNIFFHEWKSVFVKSTVWHWNRFFGFSNLQIRTETKIKMSKWALKHFVWTSGQEQEEKNCFACFKDTSLPLSLSLSHKRTLFIEPYIHSLSL